MKNLNSRFLVTALMCMALFDWTSAKAAYAAPPANFISAADDYLWVSGDDYQFGIGDDVRFEPFTVESRSATKIKISGLPSGIKYTLKEEDGFITVVCFGWMKKQGIYWVTCSAKNDNGYQHSTVSRWVVGYPPETDYDHIGLGDSVDFLNDLETGHQIYRDLSHSECDDCSGYGSSLHLKSVTGLPTGLKFYPSKCYADDFSWDAWCTPEEISGIPTKAGKYTITFTDQFRVKAVKTVVVRNSGSAYLKVAPGSGGYEGRGTASGSGVYVVGSKVKVSAKPASGCYFAGWYLDESFGEPYWMVSGSYQKASDSVDFSYRQYIDRDDGEAPPEAVYAKFVTKAEDAHPEILCADEWLVGNEQSCSCDEICEGSSWFEIETYSETLPKLTAKGLPAGIKFYDGFGLYVIDQTKLKPGVYYVTISLKNQSGAKDEKVIVVRIPNLRDSIFSGLEYDEPYVIDQYVSDACVPGWCRFEVESGWTVTASGLPSGLKFTFEKGWEDLYGSGSQSTGRITGTPTKAGTYTVTFTAKGRDAWAGKTVTRTATVTFTVNPLPAYAVGKFNGVLMDSYNEDSCIGTFSLTASSAGKLSATLTLKNGLKKSYSASSWNCKDGDGYTGYFYKRNRNGCTESEYVMFTVRPDVAWSDCQLTGEFVVDSCMIGGEGLVRAQRSPFGKVGGMYENWEAHMIAETLKSYGKMPAYALASTDGYAAYDLCCPNCCIKPFNPQTLTFTVGTDGAVKVSGKVDGMSISASSTLVVLWNDEYEEFLPQADFCLYVKQTPIWIHADFHIGYGSGGAVLGTMKYFW